MTTFEKETAEISEILEYYSNEILERDAEQLCFSRSWRREVPDEPGIYSIFERNELIYVGQTSSLRSRMGDLSRTVNHTLRRSIGNEKFRDVEGFVKASSRKKFPVDIEYALNKHMETFDIVLIPIYFGRLEIEEHLIDLYNPKYNS